MLNQPTLRPPGPMNRPGEFNHSVRKSQDPITLALLFCAGALNSYSITLLGRLTIGEILIVSTFIFVVLLSPAKIRGAGGLFGLLAAYFGSAVLTDIIRHTAFEDYARGWAKLLILGVGIIWLLKVARANWALLRYFFAGLAIAPLVNYATGAGAELGLWKFTLGPAITMFLGFWATFGARNQSEDRIAGIYLVLGVFHFLQNSRSLGMLTLFTGLVLYLGSARMLRILAGKSITTLALGAVCFLGFGYGLLRAYEYSAAQGYLGEDAELKYNTQTERSSNVISAARGEYVASWAAIADSPFIGHGSWAKDTKYIELLLAAQGIDLASAEAKSFLQTEFIPTHSHIFGAWVEAGVVGAIFWVYIFVLAVRTLMRTLRPELRAYRPLVTYLALTMLFDIIFSPFGLERRMTDAGIISGFLIILSTMPNGRIIPWPFQRPLGRLPPGRMPTGRPASVNRPYPARRGRQMPT